MTDRVVTLAGRRVLLCADDGPPLASDRQAVDLVGAALSSEASLVALPVSRLAPEFLDLKTRLAGEVLQKFVNYGLRVAIVGDVGGGAHTPGPLADFVRESNRGTTVWFVADLAELEARLQG